MPQCCDEADFQLAFALPAAIAPRLPADGAPLSAYFQFIETVDRGLETSHAFEQEVPHLTPGPPLPEGGDPGFGSIDTGVPEIFFLADEDECGKPQLAFALGVILSGTD
jgi:hypothetical protein